MLLYLFRSTPAVFWSSLWSTSPPSPSPRNMFRSTFMFINLHLRVVLILNSLTLFFRSEFRSLHWPSSFALSLFTSSNSRLISRVLTNQRLNLLPTFLLRGDLVLNFPSSGKTSFSFSFAALSSDSERAILFFNR